MLARLRRHLLPIVAHFDEMLVLTFAFPEAVLAPLVPKGLELDAHEGSGLLAVSLVRTRSLRPEILPEFMGRDFILSGYRIYSRLRMPDGRVLRGLNVLRSDVDSDGMVFWGNLLSRNRYERADIVWTSNGKEHAVDVRTQSGAGDLRLQANLAANPTALPPGSPLKDFGAATKFSDSIRYIFSHEPETDSIIAVKGARDDWHPAPVSVELSRCAFLEQSPLSAAKPVLANAIYLQNLPYRWGSGVVVSARAQDREARPATRRLPPR
jgi:hypothetical protein